MTFTIKPHVARRLFENPQTNPIRWHLLYRESETEFSDQSGEFMCKDYFNDFVAKFHGVDVCIYGMATGDMQLNEEGIYVQVKHLASRFFDNLKLINKVAVEEGMPPVEVVQSTGEVILFFPKEYMATTYRISVLTWLIRRANEATMFTSMENLLSNMSYDYAFITYIDNSSKKGEILKQYYLTPFTYMDGNTDDWYFFGERKKGSVNPSNSMYNSGNIHSNGQISWISYVNGY